MYREEGKAKCPACQRTVTAVRKLSKSQTPPEHLRVSRHLFQEGTETNGIGLPILNADGFCPGSFSTVADEDRIKSK